MPEVSTAQSSPRFLLITSRMCLFVWLGILASRGGLLRAGDAGSIASIAEREVQRRQALISTASTRLSEALAMEAEGRNSDAAKLLLETYQTLPNSAAAAEIKASVRAAYARTACAEATSLLKQARYKEAGEMIDSVLAADMDPQNVSARRLKAQAGDPERYPPALTPAHIENKAKAERLLVVAGSAVDLGDYNRAREIYGEVLRIDPHNVAARRGMTVVEEHRSRYLDSARDQARARALGEVSKGWETDVPPSADMTALFSSSSGGGSVPRGARENLQKKLHDIRIPKAEFAGATLEEVVEYLRVTSRNNDSEGVGVSFVLNVEPEARARLLTLSLTDMPLEELVRYITDMSGTAYKVDGTAVTIVSLSNRSTELLTKQYRVPPDFIQSAEIGGAAAANDPFGPAAGAGSTSGLQVRRLGAKEFLESRGVTFPEGAGASFVASTSTLIVRNTPANLDMVDTLVEQALGSTVKQVRLSVRLVDVSQEQFNEFGTDIGLNPGNLPGSDRLFFAGGSLNNQDRFKTSGTPPNNSPISSRPLMTAGLRSSGAILGKPDVDQLIRQTGDILGPEAVSPSQFSVVGVTTDPQFDFQIRAIKQSKGVDVVTSPEVVTKSGQKASIRVVREFPYPTEYDPPQIPQGGGGGGGGGRNIAQLAGNNSGPVTPATPTAFEKKELGVILEIEPNVSADGKTVDVSISPSVTEFEGFIDYGSDISNRIDTTVYDPIIPTTPLYYSIAGQRYTQQNDILQPVFKRSSANTAVTIYDGATIVLGGLIDERVTDVNDKVPLIGDIPLVGRLWQSKVKQTKKRCLLFFVTVTIIDPSGQRINQPPGASAAVSR